MGCFRPFPLIKTSTSPQPLQIVSIKGPGPLAAADHPPEGCALDIVTSRGAGGVRTGGLPILSSPAPVPLQEAVESCLTRVTKLELQQQQQQVVQLEGVENANARALLGKFINVILALMAVLLVFVSTVASFITPLMKTRLRVSSTALLALVLLLLWKHWDSLTYLLEHVLLPS